MGQDEPKQSEEPEPINIIISNHSSGNIVILGRRTYRIDGIYTIEVFIGEPGQQVKLIGDHNENIVVQDEKMLQRPGA